MTYHSANNRLMCHYCGFSQPVPRRCPQCGGPMKPMGTGTQKVEQELKELYPTMAVERMDADTISAVNTHEKFWSISSGNISPSFWEPRWWPKG